MLVVGGGVVVTLSVRCRSARSLSCIRADDFFESVLLLLLRQGRTPRSYWPVFTGLVTFSRRSVQVFQLRC